MFSILFIPKERHVTLYNPKVNWRVSFFRIIILPTVAMTNIVSCLAYAPSCPKMDQPEKSKGMGRK